MVKRKWLREMGQGNGVRPVNCKGRPLRRRSRRSGRRVRGRYGTNGNFRLFYLFHSGLLLDRGSWLAAMP